MSHESLLLVALLALLVPAIYFDVREFRIPNWLTLAGCIAGLIFSLAMGGTHQLSLAISALLVAFLIALPFWLVGWVGAGDVKLIAAVGAFMGLPMTLKALPLMAFSGLLLAFLWLARQGLILKTFSRLGSSLGLSMAAKTAIYVQPSIEEKEVKLPYAVAISAGSIIAVLLFA